MAASVFRLITRLAAVVLVVFVLGTAANFVWRTFWPNPMTLERALSKQPEPIPVRIVP
jgi:uncharacterized membrane protein YphA (DoxX/SURF4 family)